MPTKSETVSRRLGLLEMIFDLRWIDPAVAVLKLTSAHTLGFQTEDSEEVRSLGASQTNLSEALSDRILISCLPFLYLPTTLERTS